MKKTINTLLLLKFLFITSQIISQDLVPEYIVKFTSLPIMIDGNDNDLPWDSTNSINTQWTNFPNVTNDFESPTQVKMLYDDRYIYILCKAITKNKNFVIPSLRWDFSGRASDKINLAFETFSDQSKNYKIDISLYGMGSNFGDLDNDGWLDFYIGTGSPEFTSVIPNRMFRNLDGKSFEEVTSAGGFGHIQKGHGVGFADLDNDGDQDIYTVLGGAYEGDNYPNICFENPISNNNWIILKLEGVESNRSAIGTQLKLDL